MASDGMSGDETVQVDEQFCWICLGPESEEFGPLKQHCMCKTMLAHPKCIAHWQFRKAGTREEKICGLCKSKLPEWKEAIPPKCKEVTVCVQTQFHQKRIRVKTAEGGMKVLQRESNAHSQVAFTVTNPFDGQIIRLKGWSKASAALYCGAHYPESPVRVRLYDKFEDGFPTLTDAMGVCTIM